MVKVSKGLVMGKKKKNKKNLIDVGGRPPKFKTKQELINKINEYFNDENKKPTTITGLAFHLGFESRQSFYDYKRNKKYTHIIKRAALMIENGYEIALTLVGGAGNIFALKNMGWSDKHEVEETHKHEVVFKAKEPDF